MLLLAASYVTAMDIHAARQLRVRWGPVGHEVKPFLGFLLLTVMALLDVRGTVCIACTLVATAWYLLVSD